jgi:hypothetical protein
VIAETDKLPEFCMACPRRVQSGHTFCTLRGPLEEGILRGLAYADVFGFALDRDQLERYCPTPLPYRDGFDQAVGHMLELGCIQAIGPYFCLPGRHETIPTRLRREASSRAAWYSARRWGRVLWMLPFVRMVAVTGSLAAQSMEPGQDIDYLVVVEPGRLWLTRCLCLIVWCLARICGVRICPNYLLTTAALTLDQHDLYTARELVQMLPLYGRDVAQALQVSNRWSNAYLPNARLEFGYTSDSRSIAARCVKRWTERVLTAVRVDGLEAPLHSTLARALALWARWLLSGPHGREQAWRQAREAARTSGHPQEMLESQFSANVCKFHAYSHGKWILQNYRERLELLGQADEYEVTPTQRSA